MSASEAASEFNAAWQWLEREWARTRQLWPDHVGGFFETNSWTDIEADAGAFAEALDQIAQVLDEAHQAVA